MVARTTGSLDKVGSSKMTNTSIPTAGIDTSKDKLDVAVHGRPGSFTVENSPDGWAMLAARLAEIGVQRVGIEATGGSGRGVFLQSGPRRRAPG
jgi:transposase